MISMKTRAASAMLNTIVQETGPPISHWSEEDWQNLHDQFHRLLERERSIFQHQRLTIRAAVDTTVFVIANASWVIVWLLLEQWRKP
jgi:hypothetical protein